MMKRPPATPGAPAPGYDPVNGDTAALFPPSGRGPLKPATVPQAGGVPANGMPPQAQPPMGTPPGIAGLPPQAGGANAGNSMPFPAPAGNSMPDAAQAGLVNNLTQRLLRQRGIRV